MYILRVTSPNGRTKHILYKTEKGARNAIKRLEKKDKETRCILFEQVGAHYKQEQLPF